MLADYDAKAVAEVMGIAFLGDLAGGAVVVGSRAKTARRSEAISGAKAGKFVIDVDHRSVRVVEVATKYVPGQVEASKAAADRSLPFKEGRVWPPSPVLIEKAVENGLPRLALRRLAEQIAGDDKATISSLEWVIVPRTTLERREDQLSPQESERTERVARLFVHARRALGSEAEARAFMTTPHPELDGRSPLDAAKTDLATRRTEQILNALEYGLAL